MEAGADDCLTKPFVAHERRVRWCAGRRILDLQTELMAAREAPRVQAAHDALTGVPNRAGVLDGLHTELCRDSRENGPVAVLMGDVDRFKSINDAHGHQAGDEIMREAAHRVKSAMRAYDVVGRYGERNPSRFCPAAAPRMRAPRPNAFGRRSPASHSGLEAKASL